jgi:S1-C subfamily serine protease
MRAILTACLAVLLMSVVPGLAQEAKPGKPAQPNNLDKVEVFKRINAATVKVNAVYNDKWAGHGTGVSVMQCWGEGAKSGYKLVVTNSHVVSFKNEDTGAWEVAPTIKVKPYQEKGDLQLDAYVLFHEIREEEYRDIAYLVVPDPDNLMSVATLPASRSAEKGAPVYACGHPRSLEFFIDDGSILEPLKLSFKGDEATETIFHDALIEQGNSGGGLFNERGELIGINTWLYDGKVGIAQDIFWFFHNHMLGSESLNAATGTPHALWQPHISKGQGVRAMAFGKYSCTAGGEKMTATGIAGNKAARKDPNYNFGCLTFSIADTTRTFDFAYPGSDGKPIAYDGVVLSDEVSAVGKYTFGFNDKDLSDNSGTVAVVYLITGPVNLDIGLEVAEPTLAEREANELWVDVTDNTGKSVRLNAGAKVIKVLPESEAAAAGLKVGDFIMSWPGEAVGEGDVAVEYIRRDLVDASSLFTHVKFTRDNWAIVKGGGIDFKVKRDGKDVSLKLRFGVFK